MSDQFNEDYFLRGQELGISGYTDYRWLPDMTIPMVESMISYLGIEYSESVIDFGCARGYVVRAFRELEYSAWGCDISKWAIENADETVKDYLVDDVQKLIPPRFDWIIAKDVLEHIPQVSDTILELMEIALTGMFVVVPLSRADNHSYVVRDYEEDVTHIHRLTLASWARFFMRPGWSVTACYRVPGVKDNYSQYKSGNGFVTARRI